MNYKKIYDNLMKSRNSFNRKKYEGIYYEQHHIIPESFGGSNEKENLILLTAKEHFLAHLLLIEIYKDSTWHKQKMLNALMLMCNGYNSEKYNFSSRKYDIIRNEFIKEITGKSLEERFGKEKSDDIKKKLSEYNIGKTFEDRHGVEKAKQIKEKLSIAGKGRIRSIETNNKIQRTRRANNKTNPNKGKTNIEIFGEEKAKEISQKLSQNNTGRNIQANNKRNKSYEEIYGEEKADEIKMKQSKKAKGRKFSLEAIEKMRAAKIGKTYEEVYGKEKAVKMKEQRSKVAKNRKNLKK